MTLPITLANGPGNLPDAPQLNQNFVYLEGMANQNRIINPGFEIWQRGTSFTNPVSGKYTADMWFVGKGGTSVPTADITRDTGEFGSYSAKVNCTNAGSGLSDGLYLRQNTEVPSDYAGLTCTFSAWIFTTASKVSIAVFSGSEFKSAYHPGDGSWHQISVTMTLPSPCTQLVFQIGMIDFGDVTTGSFFVDGVTFVTGTQPATYIARQESVELALCQRYYQKSYALATAPATNTVTNLVDTAFVQAGSTTMYSAFLPWKIQMAFAPTVTFYTLGGTSGQWTFFTTGGSSTARATSILRVSDVGMTITQNVAVEPFGQGHFTAEAAI